MDQLSNQIDLKDLPFSDTPGHYRMGMGGEPAERQFRRWADRNKIKTQRLGFEKGTEIFTPGLPIIVRAIPDYIVQWRNKYAFFEVKGMGADTLFKIKDESIEALTFWNNLLDVRIFLYDSSKRQSAVIDWSHLTTYLEGAQLGTFNDGKPYRSLPRHLFDWEPVG